MLTASAPLITGTVHLRGTGVNTFVPMSTAGERLRSFLEERYLELGLGKRHGFVTGLSKLSGVKRGTLQSWWAEKNPKMPTLETLAPVAAVLRLSRAEIVAALDGDRVVPEDRVREMVRQEMAALEAAARREGILPRAPTGRTGSPRERVPRR
jgi:transcriptional regulator with XRE-family HTH domain